MSIKNYDLVKKPIHTSGLCLVKRGTRKIDKKEVAIKYLIYTNKEELNYYLKEVIFF
jgi:hypothetical protein